MSQLSLFNAIRVGEIETLFDEPRFKRTDLGRFLGIVDIKCNFQYLAEEATTRQEIVGKICTGATLPF